MYSWLKSKILADDLEQMLLDSNIDFHQFKDSSVFVSGATGLIGSLLIKALLYASDKCNLNIAIYGLARDPEKVGMVFGNDPISNLHILYGDITQSYSSYFKEERIDYIFHTASVTASKLMVSHPVMTIMTAIDGTNQLLSMAVEKKAKGFVYVSSMEMYGSFDTEDSIGNDCHECDLGYIDPLKVRSNYPEGKRMCENLCVAYSSEYGVPVKIARLAQTFGAGILPWENRVFAQFARSVISGQNIVLHTKGASEGNYCYAMDSVRGIMTILLKGGNAEAYNVVNSANHTTIAEMAHMVCKNIALDRIKVVFDIPETNQYGYAADIRLRLNDDKLKALGWNPKYGLEDMYRRTIEFMKETNM